MPQKSTQITRICRWSNVHVEFVELGGTVEGASVTFFPKTLKVTNLDNTFLPFFLVLYETLGLCGHPVIEKVQKIHLCDTIFAFFGAQKLVILASRLW